MISKLDDAQLETQYLIGRAYVKVYQITGLSQYSDRASSAYQQAAYLDRRCDALWMSVGVLYYLVGQWNDCHDAFSKSIRCNSNVPLVWRNLGVLVNSMVYESIGSKKLILLFSMIDAVSI